MVSRVEPWPNNTTKGKDSRHRGALRTQREHFVVSNRKHAKDERKTEKTTARRSLASLAKGVKNGRFITTDERRWTRYVKVGNRSGTNKISGPGHSG